MRHAALAIACLGACGKSEPAPKAKHLDTPGYYVVVVVPPTFTSMSIGNMSFERQPNGHYDEAAFATHLRDEQQAGRIGPLIKFGEPKKELDGFEVVADKGAIGIWYRPVSDDVAIQCTGSRPGEMTAHNCFDARLLDDGFHVPIRLDKSHATVQYTEADGKPVRVILERGKNGTTDCQVGKSTDERAKVLCGALEPAS